MSCHINKKDKISSTYSINTDKFSLYFRKLNESKINYI